MRTAEKSTRLYEELKERIDRRVYSPGFQLPHEVDLAKQFSVSRNTIRTSLDHLEQEGLVRRVQGKGTFVAAADRKLVSVLMPCEDFLFQNSDSAESMRRIFSGIMRAAREYNVRLESVVVSPTNDPRDILPHCFDGIRENSLVIVSNCWFEPVFELLHSRRAKVCLLDSQLLRAKQFPMTADWDVIDEDVIEAYDRAVTTLYENGARKIALVANFIRRPGYPRLTGYLNACARLGLPDLSCLQDPGHPEKLRENVRNFYRKSGFDALIFQSFDAVIDGAENINAWFGLPEEMEIVTDSYNPVSVHLKEPPAYFDFDNIRAGYEAVRILIRENTAPEKQLLSAEFHNMKMPVSLI